MERKRCIRKREITSIVKRETETELPSKGWQENIASTSQVTVNFLFKLFQFFCNFFSFQGFFVASFSSLLRLNFISFSFNFFSSFFCCFCSYVCLVCVCMCVSSFRFFWCLFTQQLIGKYNTNIAFYRFYFLKKKNVCLISSIIQYIICNAN